MSRRWTGQQHALVRALALRDTLASGRRWTLAQLADRFSVTTRTVRRDLAALKTAGVPVCSEQQARWLHGRAEARTRYWVLA